MTFGVRQQLLFWGIFIVASGLLLWGLGNVLTPFVTGAAMAYFLNPLVLRLTGLGLPRTIAVSLLMLAMLMAFVLAGLVIVPAVIGQIVQLSQTAPDLLEQLRTGLTERFPNIGTLETALEDSLVAMGEAIRERGTEFAQVVLSSVSGVVSALIFLVITPVVAFYLMLDWGRFVRGIDALLPRDHAPVIRDLAGQIDAAIAGFVRGQVTVCLILAAYYATALGLVGLQFGLAIGVVAGLISFIPYIGAIAGGALSIGLALYQFWGDPVFIGLVVGVFVIGQVLEGNILVPRIVGNSVRLHPVWLLFAISAFGTLFGFTGMLIAVPVAASLGVLVRYGVRRYLDSAIYDSSGTTSDTNAADASDETTSRNAPAAERAPSPNSAPDLDRS